MKGFIEITEIDGDMKILCPIDKITAIVRNEDGSVFIETGLDRKGVSSGIFVAESFDEIKEKINLSEV